MGAGAAEKGRWGFTLVEILIVVAIIGILLAVAVPTFMRARENSQAKNCQSNLKQVVGAKERWAMDNSRDSDATPTFENLVPDYIRVTPVCPSGGTYTINSMNTTPTCSKGGTPGATNAHVVP